MKSLKLALSILVITSFAACASVTDSNLEEAGQSVTETTQDNGRNADPDNIWDGDGGDDMDPTIDPPPPAEWN